MNVKKLLSLFLITSLSSNSIAVSITKLIEQGKIPAITQDKKLSLSGLHIDSLEGLEKIPGIEKVEVLGLNDNDFTQIPARALAPCKSLKSVGLRNNKINLVESGAFNGPPLQVIILNKNKLASLPDLAPLAGQLKLLSVNNNPLPKKEIQKLEKTLPKTKISKGPITEQALVAIGVTAAVIAAAVAAVGIYAASKKEGGVTSKKEKEGGADELFMAAAKGDLKGVRAALAAGADVNSTEKELNMTALMAAARLGNKEIVDLLLKQTGIKLDLLDKRKRTALTHAAGAGHRAVVELLLNAGANASLGAPLVAAIYGHKGDILDRLLPVADVNDRTDEGLTALLMAIVENDSASFNKILQKNPDLNASNNDGYTPLMMAAAGGTKQMVDALLKAGARIDVTDKEGHKILHVFIHSGEPQKEALGVLESLLKAGADVNTDGGAETLIWAIDQQHIDTAKDILSRIDLAFINYQRHYGQTALMEAARIGNEELVRLLLEKGAQIGLKDYRGKTALNYATKKEIQDLLQPEAPAT